MEASRKPLARVEGRRRLRLSGLTIVWRGTPSLDDWVVYIVRAESKNFILADHALERKVLSQLQTMSKKKVEEIAKVEAHERERASTKAIGGAFCDAKSHIRSTRTLARSNLLFSFTPCSWRYRSPSS